ncbi:hypothetical protein D3C81_1386720 [compost metagenome]
MSGRVVLPIQLGEQPQRLGESFLCLGGSFCVCRTEILSRLFCGSFPVFFLGVLQQQLFLLWQKLAKLSSFNGIPDLGCLCVFPL